MPPPNPWFKSALEDNLKGRTVLVIAHRMATIRDADVIAVLEKGAVVEQGDHDSLLALGGRYAEGCTDCSRGIELRSCVCFRIHLHQSSHSI